MEEEKKLYPFRVVPIEGENELIQVADLGYIDSEIKNGWLAASTISEVMDMYMDRVVGEGVFGYYGRQFPVLIKFRDLRGKTPLTVHPDDIIAEERFDFLGKAKLWYVQSAAPGAKIHLGFARDVTSREFYEACMDGSVEKLLNTVEVRKGDSYFIWPGMVHATDGEMTLVEISESSPLDFRLFSWEGAASAEGDSEFTLEAAFDFIDYRKYSSCGHCEGACDGSGNCSRNENVPEHATRLTDNPEFTVHEVRLRDSLHIFCEKFGSFVTYTCLSGSAMIQVNAEDGTETYPLNPRETIIVPAEVPDFILTPASADTLLLETMVEAQDAVDQYIAADDGSDDDDAEAADIDGTTILS